MANTKSNHSLVVKKNSKSNKKIVFSDKDKFDRAVDNEKENIELSIEKISDIEEELKKLKLLQKELIKEEKAKSKKPAPKKVTKKEQPPKIDVNQKHTIVPHQEFDEKDDYDYDERREEWHKNAGHNESQLVCNSCKDDDNWETILLDDDRHICYYCWIKKAKNQPAKVNKSAKSKKKPTTKKPSTKSSNSLVVKKANKPSSTNKTNALIAKPEKPKIPENQKHTIVSEWEFENEYNYNQRREDWHKKAGHNTKQLVCDYCKDDDNWETIWLDNDKQVCYYCWIKKPENLKTKKETPTKSKALVVKKANSRVVKEKTKEIDYEKIYPVELETLRTAFQVLPRPIQKEYEKKIYRMIDRLIELKFIDKRH